MLQSKGHRLSFYNQNRCFNDMDNIMIRRYGKCFWSVNNKVQTKLKPIINSIKYINGMKIFLKTSSDRDIKNYSSVLWQHGNAIFKTKLAIRFFLIFTVL